MKCQCKKSLNAPTESGVVVRVSGLYAKHSHSTQDGVEFIPAVFYAAASRNIGVLLRYNGKCRAWANNLYASPDAVEKLIVEFVQRYEKFSDKQKLEFKTKNGLRQMCIRDREWAAVKQRPVLLRQIEENDNAQK